MQVPCCCATSPFTAALCYPLPHASSFASVAHTFYSHIVTHVVISQCLWHCETKFLQEYCITCCYMQVPLPLWNKLLTAILKYMSGVTVTQTLYSLSVLHLVICKCLCLCNVNLLQSHLITCCNKLMFLQLSG
jgi:hypothetical protein